MQKKFTVAVFEEQAWTDRTQSPPKAKRLDNITITLDLVGQNGIRSVRNFARGRAEAVKQAKQLGLVVRKVSLVADADAGFDLVVYVANRGAAGAAAGLASKKKKAVRPNILSKR